jgi:uncharacterized protein
MMAQHFSVIMVSTLKCNAACEYCFENKTEERMTHERLAEAIDKVMAYLAAKRIPMLTMYWQGGEAMLLPPRWYEEAYDIIDRAAVAHGVLVSHNLQTNLLAYSDKWNDVIASMFGNCVGTSMDFPNLYRRVETRTPEDYTALWLRKLHAARRAGIDVKVIAIPNRGSVELGAERFYNHFVNDLEIVDFQVNTGFPGGEASQAKAELANADMDRMVGFYRDLAEIWLERGYPNGVSIGPFDELLNHFSQRQSCLPCIWRQNCTAEFVSIDAHGTVAQCDCWVASYPEYCYGNIFECENFEDLLLRSRARQDFNARPEALMHGDCIECDYLSLCHGGCPVRAYSAKGSLFEKDPNCQLYKSMFGQMRAAAETLARHGGASAASCGSCATSAAAAPSELVPAD